MRRVASFGLKIVQFLVSKKFCVINASTMREFVENHLIKCNQPSTSQPTFTCSKLTMETLEHGRKICSRLTIKTPERRNQSEQKAYPTLSGQFPKLSESYNSHLLKLVKLTIATCLKLIKDINGHFFTCPKLRKKTGEISDFYVDAKT